MVDGMLARLQLAPELAEVSSARRFVRAELDGRVPSDTLADLQLITSELVTNAMLHALPTVVTVTLRQDDDSVAVTVVSEGASTGVGPTSTWSVADVDEVTGRGLGIVRGVADRIEVAQSTSRLSVTATCLTAGD